MKKIIIISIIIMLPIFFLNAQWIIQNSSGSELYDVHFINSNTGWACGFGSTILKTTNGGTNWIYQPHPGDDRNLMGIHPVDSNIVYCVGYFETILKTTNGGTNWILLKSGPFSQSPSFSCVFFINILTGWICRSASSSRPNILKTTNGGISFDSSYLFATINDIYFKDAQTGIVCGSPVDMFKTTNGGVNWLNVFVPNGGSLPEFKKISFVNNQYGWIVGGGSEKRVFRTTNFGSSWDSIGRVWGADVVECSFFSDTNTGWVGCSFTGAKLWKSTNGGYNWYAQNNYPTGAFIGCITFLDNNTGWTVGGGGYIVKTTNGGLTFITEKEKIITNNFELFQNYPNPFNIQTNIEFNIINNDEYKLEVYNIEGKKIDVLFEIYKQKGKYTIRYDASNLSTGVYFYKLSSPNEFTIKKFLVIR